MVPMSNKKKLKTPQKEKGQKLGNPPDKKKYLQNSNHLYFLYVI
jgi:hypothetical protein